MEENYENRVKPLRTDVAETKVRERTYSGSRNVALCIVSGILVLIGIVFSILWFGFDFVESVILSLALIAFYIVLLFFLLGRTTIREITRVRQSAPVQPQVIRQVESPVVRYIDRPVERIVEKPVIRYVDKPVIKTVVKEVPVVKTRTVYKDRIIRPKPITKTVYKTKYKTRVVRPKVKKLNIPKFDYVGSTQTRTYHTRNCRLGKLIKKKYKLMDNNPEFFKKRHFKSCKICIQHLRKS